MSATVKIDAPTWERREQLVEWLRTEGQVEVLNWTSGMNACVLAAKLGVGVLRAFNIDVQPLPVLATVFSPNFSAYLRDEKPELLARMKDMRELDFNLNFLLDEATLRGVSMVGVDGKDGENHWAGHVGILTGDTFVDLTIEQAQRPSLDITDLDAVVTDVSEAFKAGLERHLLWQGRYLIAYQRTDNYRFVTAPDWCGPNMEVWVDEVAAKIDAA